MKQLDKELTADFESFVAYWVGKSYKTGILGKARTRWQLTKAWNSRLAHAGIPGIVRKQLGEEEATRLFQDTSDKILSNKVLLELAIDNFRSQDMFNQL